MTTGGLGKALRAGLQLDGTTREARRKSPMLG